MDRKIYHEGYFDSIMRLSNAKQWSPKTDFLICNFQYNQIIDYTIFSGSEWDNMGETNIV